MTPIYLDHNATTPLDPEVLEEMTASLRRGPGNPSSMHAFGQEARRTVERARVRAARLIGAQPEEIVLTSGGTEANNIAVLGAVAAAKSDRPHVVTTAIEHQAVLNPCRRIERSGGSVTFLPVNRDGVVDSEGAVAALRDDTVLASIMLANNDVGSLQPVTAISPAARERGVVFHADAVQAVGKIPVDVRALGVDLLSFSGHKIYGPQGTGALYIRKGVEVSPRTFGGRQERGLRPGTENVGAIAGFGKACELAAKRLDGDAAYLAELRSSFETAILRRIPGATVNAGASPRLPNTSNIAFEGLVGELLAFYLDELGVAVSTVAACSSANKEPSHVLIAMGRTPEEARSAVRFSFGRGNTREEMLRAADLVVQAVESFSPESLF